MPGRGEEVLGKLVAQNPGGAVEREAKVHQAHTLVVRPERVIRAEARHVARRVHQVGLRHCRAGRCRALVDEELAHQRRAAGHPRRRVTGARRGRVELLAEREEVVRVARCTATGKRAHAGRDKARERGPVRPRRRGLRDATRHMRARSHQIRLLALVVGGAAARERDDIVKAIRASVGDQAAVVTGGVVAAVGDRVRMAVLRGTDRDDVLRGARGADGIRSRPGVSGREDDDHLLVSGHGHGRARRLRVPNQCVVALGVEVVRPERVRAPTVRADPGAVVVRPRLEILEVRKGEEVRVKDHRGSDPYERRDTEAVPEPARVRVRKARQVVEAAHDVRVEVAVPVAALDRAPRVRGALQAIVDHAANPGRESVLVQSGVIGQGGGVVDAAVRHVDGEARGAELSLREALAQRPRKVASRGRVVARHVARDNLILPLVILLGLRVAVDGNDVRLSGDFVDPVGRDTHDDVHVVQNLALVPNRLQPEPVDHLNGGGVSLRVRHELYREQIVRDRGSGVGMNLVGVRVGAIPLHDSAREVQRLESGQACRIAIHEIRIARNVRQHRDARLGQRFVPSGLNRSGELDEVQTLASKGPGTRSRGRRLRCGGVKGADVEQNALVVVPDVHGILPSQGLSGRRVGVEELETPIIGHDATAALDDRADKVRIADPDLHAAVGGNRRCPRH